MAEERERCRVLENALEVLATEHEAVLHSVELAGSTGSLSSANSVYYSPPESIADLDDAAWNGEEEDGDQSMKSPPDSEHGSGAAEEGEEAFEESHHGVEECNFCTTTGTSDKTHHDKVFGLCW